MSREIVGTIEALWRYPVRSVLGEALQTATLGKFGVVGDRSYSIVDASEFAMVSAAISARKWSALVGVRAAFVTEPSLDAVPPLVRLTFPDGEELLSDSAELAARLTALTGRETTLWSGQTSGARKSDEAEARTDGKTSPKAPYELMPIHLLTTASVRAAVAAYPEGVFDPIRFRPNIVLDTPDAEGFVESSWLGKSLAIGDKVRLKIDDNCVRCVMTTLSHGAFEEDKNILKTVHKANDQNLGIYASVESPGVIRQGDFVKLVS
jgi:hypothetical protein